MDKGAISTSRCYFIIDVGYHKIAVQEANALNIPVVGVVDTNNSPAGVDYVIPGNDDSSGRKALCEGNSGRDYCGRRKLLRKF